MEPLTIDSSRPHFGELLGMGHELGVDSAVLEVKIAPKTAQGMSSLVLGMNCYYSNLIEGHRTLPADIARALRDHQDVNERRDLKSLSIAHIEAEKWARKQNLLAVGILPFASTVHRIFAEHLPPAALTLENGKLIAPGVFRKDQGDDVVVGNHRAPDPTAVSTFLARFDAVYSQVLSLAHTSGEHQLKAIASCFMAHHRFSWIHPFMDGNGRVGRILLDAMLRSCGLNKSGLWSMSRGYSKTQDKYKAALAGADQSRMGDHDGRGNLSEKKLIDFCKYSIQTARDQSQFMYGLFDIETLHKRIDLYFRSVRTDLKPQCSWLYSHAISSGEFDRMEAGRLTGMPERSARIVLSSMVTEGFLVSDTPKGRVRAGFPMKAIEYIFPNLYPVGSTADGGDDDEIDDANNH